MSAMKLLFIPALAATSLALGVAVFAAPRGGGPGFIQIPVGLQPLQAELRAWQAAIALVTRGRGGAPLATATSL